MVRKIKKLEIVKLIYCPRKSGCTNTLTNRTITKSAILVIEDERRIK